MLTALRLHPGAQVLVIGAGSGFVPAALAHLCSAVHVVERSELLLPMLEARMNKLGLDNVHLHLGDGRQGWPGDAPFDGILVAASDLVVGPALMEQVAPGGSVVATMGPRHGTRTLLRYLRDERGTTSRHELGPLRITSDLGDILVDLGLTDAEVAERARRLALRDGEPLHETLSRLTRLDERDVYRALAQQRGMAHAGVKELIEHIELDVCDRIPRAFLEHQRMLPIGHIDGQICVVTTEPGARSDEIATAYPGEEVALYLVSPTDFRRIWSAIELRQARGEDYEPTVKARGRDILDLDPSALEGYAVSVFDALLLDAIGERASDIHLEQYGQRVRVRMRVDGELLDQPRYKISPPELSALVNVIKVRAKLDISEKRLPQGGRIHLRAGDEKYDLRVQTQPSLHGEHVVIRLLAQEAKMLEISDLGFPAEIGKKYRRLLDSPSGLVLVVGPTGSGKSTTLYAGLSVLAKDARRKVITVEDPIEYSIDNVQQVQARPNIGFGFARAMRSFVREDPDVILVGEIRDAETALEAIRASQTGHLVLSTLHCNDAVDSVQRLYDLGMHPNSIASELLAVFSQRLARRICRRCRVEDTPDPELLAEIFPDGAPSDFKCFVGKGCPSCNHRGARGRVAVGEYLAVNADIRRAISRQPPLDDLRAMAREAGLHSLRASLLAQIEEGLVPLREARRLLHAEALAASS
jgi:type IV pilus assembly protein PilB